MGNIGIATYLAQKFHERYEQIAPEYNYKTREESAVPWSRVPPENKGLMIETCRQLINDGIVKVKVPHVAVCNCHCVVPTWPTFRANQHVQPCKYAEDDTP